MDFDIEIQIINKKHPKHKQILKIFNNLVEHGIKQRENNLFDNGFIILFCVFEKLSNSKMFNQVKYELNKKVIKLLLMSF